MNAKGQTWNMNTDKVQRKEPELTTYWSEDRG